MQDRSDAGHEGCRTGVIRTGGVQDRKDAGKVGCGTGEMQDRRRDVGRSRAVDPHSFYADPDLDPDPAVFLNADPDPDPDPGPGPA